MIELRRMAVIDLSVRYARSMGGNKIRHYRISAMGLITNHFSRGDGLGTDKIISDYIKKTEGEEVSFVEPSKEWTHVAQDSNGPLRIKDVSDLVLKDNSDIKKSLNKVKGKVLIHEYNVYNSVFVRLLNPIKNLINRAIYQVNRLLARLQGTSIAEMYYWEKWGSHVDNVRLIPPLPVLGEFSRRGVPCRFLTVAFEEGDLQEAVDSILDDLKILNNKGLIMGHLVMPSLIAIADDIGSGKAKFCLFCYLYVDDYKLMDITGHTPPTLPKRALELIGVKNDTSEGGVNFLNGVDPRSKYEIEEVIVSVQLSSDEMAQAHKDNYVETRDEVNRIAKGAKQMMGSARVENKTSANVGLNAVEVKADIVDANGEKVTLDELYRNNNKK